MFFILAKVFGFFALPSNLLIGLGFIGLVLTTLHFRRAGVALMVTSIVLLAVLGLTPAGNALILPLEERFPAWDATRGEPHGIIVLGGSFDTVVAPARGEVSLNEAAERLTATADLARRYPEARILFSGGSGRLFYNGTSEADLAIRLFESFGIARGRVELDDKSRDTDENAQFSKLIAKPKPYERWLLVTSAHHMPRSIGAFRQAGFPIEAYPVDFRTRGTSDLVRPFQSVSEGLRRTDTAAREWVGLIVYWMAGRTSELFPGPAGNGRIAAPSRSF
jgi:uncharacterized SAM-binding protein YcdF (DUF218 family)